MRVMSEQDVADGFAVAVAATAEAPVMIWTGDQAVAVLLSPSTYARLVDARVAAFTALCDRIAADVAAGAAPGLDDVVDEIVTAPRA